MELIYCSSVLIKFLDRSSPQQEITPTHVTGAHRLAVIRDSHFITVMCQTKDCKTVKELNFNISDIKEYVCEGVYAISV